MAAPVFSVIIPAFNHAKYLGDAVQSVLVQTFTDFEVIVVDDASTDGTNEVMAQFHDPRVRYIVHPQNQGSSATRNTGIKASSADLIAFLDADDYFHPLKLEMHYQVLSKNPEIGVTYNARYELHHSLKTIRDIWRPPVNVELLDFVLGFPFGPSDMVIRKEWLYKIGLLESTYVYYGDDLYLYLQLALSGCRFQGIDRALNYRRYYAGRLFKNISKNVSIELDILSKTFSDPRCPKDVQGYKDISVANFYLQWCFFALAQDEIHLGQTFLKEIIRLKPSVLDGEICQLLYDILDFSISDHTVDHEQLLKKLLRHLPDELVNLNSHSDWLVAQGYLRKGVREVIWGRVEEGGVLIDKAVEHKAIIDSSFLDNLSYQVLSYEQENESEAARIVMQNLCRAVKKVGGDGNEKLLLEKYFKGRVFMLYKKRDYRGVVKYEIRDLPKNLGAIRDRGIIRLFINSVIFSFIYRSQPSQFEN